jgi:hypothetical protein
MVVIDGGLSHEARRAADRRLHHLVTGRCGSAISALITLRELLDSHLKHELPEEVQNLLVATVGHLQKVVDWCRSRHVFEQLEESSYVTSPTDVDLQDMMASLAVPGSIVSADALMLEIDGMVLKIAIDEFHSNALNFGKPGSPIRTSARFVDGQLRVQVRNEHDGGVAPLTPVECAGVFKPGYKASSSSAMSDGIGLHSVALAVRAIGGSASLECDAAATTAHVCIPATVCAPARCSASSRASSGGSIRSECSTIPFDPDEQRHLHGSLPTFTRPVGHGSLAWLDGDEHLDDSPPLLARTSGAAMPPLVAGLAMRELCAAHTHADQSKAATGVGKLGAAQTFESRRSSAELSAADTEPDTEACLEDSEVREAFSAEAAQQMIKDARTPRSPAFVSPAAPRRLPAGHSSKGLLRPMAHSLSSAARRQLAPIIHQPVTEAVAPPPPRTPSKPPPAPRSAVAARRCIGAKLASASLPLSAVAARRLINATLAPASPTTTSKSEVVGSNPPLVPHPTMVSPPKSIGLLPISAPPAAPPASESASPSPAAPQEERAAGLADPAELVTLQKAPAALRVVGLDDELIPRMVQGLFMKHHLKADLDASVALGKSKEEIDAFIDVALGQRNPDLSLNIGEARQADVVLLDHNISPPKVFGSLLAAELRQRGYTGVTVLLTGTSSLHADQLSALPDIDLVFDKGYALPKMAEQIKQLLANKMHGA